MNNGSGGGGGDATGMRFAEALGEAISSSGLSLQEVSDALARRGTNLTSTMLSYWRSGRSVPGRRSSHEALWQVEEILGLSAGHLVNTLVDAAEVWLPDAVLPPFEGLEEALAETGLDLTRRAAPLLVHDSAVVEGLCVERTIRQVMRVEREEVASVALVLLLPARVEVEVTSVNGAVDWRLVSGTADASLLLVALPLPPGSRSGDVVSLEAVVRTRTAEPATGFVTLLSGRVDSLVQDVTFEAPVAAAWQEWREGVYTSSRERTDLAAGRHCQMVRRPGPPGLHTLAWTR